MNKRSLTATIRKHAFDLALSVLALASFVLMLIASTDPVPAFLKGTEAHGLLKQFSTGNQVVFDLAVGVLASLLMYVLVVRVPENSKRRRVKANLAAAYESFKRDSIAIYLGCFMQSYPFELPSQLADQRRFREFFKEPFTDGQTKWDAVANNLTETRLKALVVELEILMTEVHFTLTSIDVQDSRAFGFLKSLARIIYRSKNWTTDYDDVKSLLGFLWSLHTGWNWVTGYAESDPIEQVIAAV